MIYAERLKKFGNWLVTQILSEAKVKVRVRVYCKWVLIAKHCVMLNNFSSTCAILAGLNHQAVTRMVAFLRLVPEDVRELKQEMEDNFMGFSDNYARGMIDDCIKGKLPCIPTIDVLRKDVLRIDEGSKGDEDEGLIKFFKIYSFGKAISFIEKAYSQPFAFESTFPSERQTLIMKWMLQMPNAVKSLSVLMRMSFAMEPPSGRELKGSIYKKYLNSTEKE
jgi:hypothetical protein